MKEIKSSGGRNKDSHNTETISFTKYVVSLHIVGKKKSLLFLKPTANRNKLQLEHRECELPAVLGCIQCQEAKSWKCSGQRVKMRGQAGRKSAPRCVEQHQCTVTAVWVQELHQVLRERTRTNMDNYIFNRVKFCVGRQHSAIN